MIDELGLNRTDLALPFGRNLVLCPELEVAGVVAFVQLGRGIAL